ncbi:heterokaryon incompatibility protein-domain-containing protein [Cladorrhinum sp. PSN259]|nr:heterokaryon incompatibility protein-domain-containing protein [Cladorrhinum sp. PSN259]
MDDRYIYRPLKDQTSIRLIKVTKDLVDGQIGCIIQHFDTETARSIKYHALSYNWGDPTPTREISISESDPITRIYYTRPVHENLWRFLKKCWALKLDHWLWTDSLCLDQNDAHEIKHQVLRMGEIYSHANQVLIWLGDNHDDEEALWVLGRWQGRTAHSRPSQDDAEEIENANKAFDLASVAANRVLSLPYWRRVWIVQEVVLAAKVHVMCGDIVLDLDDLRQQMSSFRYNNRDYHYLPNIWTLCKLRRIGGKMPLRRILLDFRACESSRVDDKVYGFFGLIASNADGTSPTDFIDVDYTRPAIDLFFDAAFECGASMEELPTILDSLEHSLLPHRRGPTMRDLSDYHGRAVSASNHRHALFSAIAIQVLSAVHTLVWNARVFGPRPGSFDDQTNFVHLSLFTVTQSQNAALVALALLLKPHSSHTQGQIAAKLKSLGQDHKPSTPSPWHCGRHQDFRRVHKPPILNNGFDCASIALWDPATPQKIHELGKKLCGGAHKSECDLTFLAFEVPGADICLFVTQDWREGEYRNKLFFRLNQDC